MLKNRKANMLIGIFAAYSIVVNVLMAQDKIPDRDQRIYSLSVMWKELQYNFAFPENFQQANLDSLYLAYLPKVEQVKDNYEYYRLLSSFMTHFNEAHTRFYANRRPDDAPPVNAINFGEKIIVNNIARNMAGKIPLGSEILKIDDIPVMEYLKDSVYPYIPAATPQWKLDKSVLEMFYGRPLSVVKITVKTPDGKIKDAEMTRNYNANGSNEPMADTTRFTPINIKILDGNIGYIQLRSCMGGFRDTVNKVFNNYLPQLRKCKGLIIDVRGNRGGSDQVWENIAFHLIPESNFDLGMTFYTRINNATYKNWGKTSTHPQVKEYYLGTAMSEVQHSQYENKVDSSLKLLQPLIIISGQHVASAAEDFLLLMKNQKRATIVGEPSVGCVGEPVFIDLPGGFGVMMCAKKYVYPDNSQPNETGILPDIKVERDYNLYLKKKDNVLDYAVKELQKPIKK